MRFSLYFAPFKGKSYENKMDEFRFLGNCSPVPSLRQLWVGGFL